MVPFQRNRQYGNVGNLGDILKHGILVRLLQAVAGPDTHRVVYVDPYAFIPTWPCANRRWLNEVDALVHESRGFARYRALEHVELRAGRPYLCSVGIVRKVLNRASLVLAEKEEFERSVLRDELGADATIYDDAAALTKALGSFLTDDPLVVALIDPFHFDGGATAVLKQFLGTVANRKWAAVLFDFDDGARGPGFADSLRATEFWLRTKTKATRDKSGKKTRTYRLGLAGTLSGLDEVAKDCLMDKSLGGSDAP